jgi:triacylglycerol lipase
MKTFIITVLLCLFLTIPADAVAQDRIILIHGLGRSPLSLIWIQWSLERAGYQVSNLRYPSRNSDALHIAGERLDEIIRKQNETGSGQIHFVTHSLGGIIVRNYLATHTVPNLGRVVMLAPPNHGSELADSLKKNWLGRLMIGPVGCELGTAPTDLPAQLGPAHFPLGIIAADGPGIMWNFLVCKAPSDGIVSVESARLDGMTDFMTVHSDHNFILLRSNVREQILSFLKEGHFAH